MAGENIEDFAPIEDRDMSGIPWARSMDRDPAGKVRRDARDEARAVLVRALAAEGLGPSATARMLNQAGMRPMQSDKFTCSALRVWWRRVEDRIRSGELPEWKHSTTRARI